MELEERLRGVEPAYQAFGMLFLLGTQLETIGDSVQALGELTTKQWFVLLNLEMFFTAPPTLTQLAERMGTSRQNVKAIVEKLARKGFVVLRRDACDARALRVELVKARAEDYERRNGQANDAFLRAFMGVLSTAEVEILGDCLLRLSAQAAQMRGEWKQSQGGR